MDWKGMELGFLGLIVNLKEIAMELHSTLNELYYDVKSMSFGQV